MGTNASEQHTVSFFRVLHDVYIPQDSNIHNYSRENVVSHMSSTTNTSNYGLARLVNRIAINCNNLIENQL
jgi:hypothetical protein